MNYDKKNYPPLLDIDNLESSVNHSMVLYDKEEYGQIVRNRFIENGLKKGETSVCITHDEIDKVENEMKQYGIDVDLFKQKKLLQVIHIKNLMEDEGGVYQGFIKLVNQMTSELKPPFRFTGRVIPDISTKEGIEEELRLEKLFHSNFNKFKISFLCTYPVSAIEVNDRPKWLKQLMENHHNLIYATDSAKSVTFDPELLGSIMD